MKKQISIFLATFLLLSVFTLFVPASVGAAAPSYPPHILYITDSVQTHTTYSGYLQTVWSDVRKCYEPDQASFWAKIDAWASGSNVIFEDSAQVLNRYAEIHNAVVVFEVSQGLFKQEEDPNNLGDLYGSKLNAIFGQLKDNNCQILFICSTDESRFENQNSFLRHVDFHVNTDLMTVFAANVINSAKASGGDSLEYTTFLINENCMKAGARTNPNEWVFLDYLISYLKQEYESDFQMVGATPQLVLQNKNIHILVYVREGGFRDIFGPSTSVMDISDPSFDNDYLSGQQVVAVGSTVPSPEGVQSFLDCMEFLYDDYCYGTPLYLFHPNSTVYEYLYDHDLYVLGQGMIGYPQMIQDILMTYGNEGLGFDSESMYNTMYPYANWSWDPLCYKPLVTGAGGWIEHYEPVGAWQIAMTENDYNSYVYSGFEGIVYS